MPQARKTLQQMVSATSLKVGSDNRDAIFKSLVEEVGELATEIAIEDGTKKRQASPDGVVGEAIDVLVVILDLLHYQLGENIHGQEFLDRVQSKLNKWEGKANV
jgi:NTP pyrophosphatase (non-canonical NTP hydrolase)